MNQTIAKVKKLIVQEKEFIRKEKENIAAEIIWNWGTELSNFIDRLEAVIREEEKLNDDRGKN